MLWAFHRIPRKHLMSALHITKSHQDGAVIFDIAGRLDSQTTPELEAAVLAAESAVVIDLSGLEYISSAGLRGILQGLKRANAAGDKFVVCGLQPSVQRVFDLSGFSTLLAVFPDRAAALDELTK